MAKTIIVSNRLPVKFAGEGAVRWKTSEGGLATGLGSMYKQGDNLWIGWPGLVEEDQEQQEHIREDLAELNLRPVFLTEDEISYFYEGFSNETLWPIFHYMSSYAHFEQQYWEAYQYVNEKFMRAVVEVADPEDTIWIHDYQLLLLPQLLRQALPKATIGFFQHIPFPSYELFRLIPWRAPLLEGILGADLIGFHTFDDARHFISSATRLLPIHNSANILSTNNRSIIVEAFPMGIDFQKYESLTSDPNVEEDLNSLRTHFTDRKLILSIDRLDYSKGILQRLYAFELLLENHPEYIGEVVLYMVVVPSRDTVPRYRELRDEVDKLVGNINARFRTIAWNPIHYFYRSLPLETLSALYQSADVCLVTPMRDGMNLVCKEFIASRKREDGVLILSEMAGASKELLDAVMVNPNNIEGIKEAIVEALHMPLEEQQRRMKTLRQVVSKFNIHHWVRIFMERLKEVKEYQHSQETKHINPRTMQGITEDFLSAGKRVIFLDYDGTLVGFKNNIDEASPDKELYELLDLLSSDPRNKVAIISGRKHETLDEWFADQHIDLVAEHGAWNRIHGGEWINMPGLSDAWKQDIAPILELYTDRTPGSFIEEKNYSLVWHYRKVETGLGELRAGELLSNLRFFAADRGLQLLQGDKVLEVKNAEVNKGKAVTLWLQEENYDFMLAIGDDHTDEDIFKALPDEAVSIKVGSNISAARYYVLSYVEVRQCLRYLIDSGTPKFLSQLQKNRPI